jgi:hypothetical protein
MNKLGKGRKVALAGMLALGLGGVAFGNVPAANAGVGLAPATHMIKVSEVKQADPKVPWSVQINSGQLQPTYCGVASTEGKGVKKRFARAYTDDMASYGRQHVTEYATVAAANAAHTTIVRTILSCTASKPAPTHARKITENRVVKGAAGATRVIRWYDYPKPNDPGSEAGGFPYAVTVKGTVVSVLAFSGYGPGMAAPNFDKLARTAATKLP